MGYLYQLLQPGERVVYRAFVHPVVCASGLGWMLAGTGLYWWWDQGPPLRGMAAWAASWVVHYVPLALQAPPYLAAAALAGGAIALARGVVTMLSTEVAVTDHRVVAKVGIYSLTTIELDRRRIAAVMVHQPFWGRCLGYGYIAVQGFSAGLGGGAGVFPPLMYPYRLQRHINAPIGW